MFEADPSFRGLIGVGRADMTPHAGIYSHNWGSSTHPTANSIHRPLYVTALCIRPDAQDRPLVLVSMDYCWFPSYHVLQSLRHPVLERLGIEDHRFLLVLTHSHAVPHIDAELESKPGGEHVAAYRAKVTRALNAAIDQALLSAQPAILSWGKGSASLVRTRDFHDAESGRILCGPNPDGVPDSTLMVGRVTAEADGAVLATLVNYACHPVSLGGGNRSVSPDYVGALRELMEGHTRGAPCLFLHGPSGNQTPRDSYSNDPAVADRNGEVLGFAALSVLSALLPPGERLEFARTERSGTDLAVWERRAYRVDDAASSSVSRLQLPRRDWPHIAEIDAMLCQTSDEPTRVRLMRKKQYMMNLQEGLGAGFPVWAMRLGRSIIIGTPAEPFSDLQSELRRRFPGLAILVTNDTNGSFNYLPPRHYFGNGAYEQDCTDFAVGALEQVIEGASNLIRELFQLPAASA